MWTKGPQSQSDEASVTKIDFCQKDNSLRNAEMNAQMQM
jgi:hypothetical protein